MSKLAEKVKRSIERIKAYNPEDFGFSVRGGDNHKYHLGFSGGKDSVVTKRLLDMAGVKYDATYRVTSVDPPELVTFIKEHYPEVTFEIPREQEWDDTKMRYCETGRPITMWSLIPQKLIPPTRLARYCCEYLKETMGNGGMTVTGVRWDESNRRAVNQGIITLTDVKDDPTNTFSSPPNSRRGVVLMNDNADTRQVLDVCAIARRALVNPIIDWTHTDVWEFIRAENIPYCGLYDEGCTRLGCIGCPMGGSKQMIKELNRWPKYKTLYLLAFQKMLKAREENGKDSKGWHSAEDVMRWWTNDPTLDGQLDLFEEGME